MTITFENNGTNVMTVITAENKDEFYDIMKKIYETKLEPDEWSMSSYFRAEYDSINTIIMYDFTKSK